MALMISAMATARMGMLASVARLNASASNIANGNATEPLPRTSAAQPLAPAAEGTPRVDQPVDLAEEAIAVLEASLLFKANVAVFKTADEMTRGLLDITA